MGDQRIVRGGLRCGGKGFAGDQAFARSACSKTQQLLRFGAGRMGARKAARVGKQKFGMVALYQRQPCTQRRCRIIDREPGDPVEGFGGLHAGDCPKNENGGPRGPPSRVYRS